MGYVCHGNTKLNKEEAFTNHHVQILMKNSIEHRLLRYG